MNITMIIKTPKERKLFRNYNLGLSIKDQNLRKLLLQEYPCIQRKKGFKIKLRVSTWF